VAEEEESLLEQDVETLQQLILRISWAEQRRFAQQLSNYGLTVPQFFALVAIWRHGQECPIGQLANATMQCSATMTGIIDRLAERGLVERADPADRPGSGDIAARSGNPPAARAPGDGTH